MIRWILVIDGIVFAAIGLIFCFDVHRYAKSIDLVLSSRTSIIDFRATYGGLDLGLGLFFLAAAFIPKLNWSGVLCAALTLFGLLITRICGLFAEGMDPFMVKLMLIEILMTAANLFFVFRNQPN